MEHEATESVHRTLPRAWEEEQGFHDALYDWMSRAPWLALSGVAHVMVFLLLSLVPWNLIEKREPKVVEMQLAEALEEPWVDPTPEELPQPLEELPETEPVLQEADVAETDEALDFEDFQSALGDPKLIAESPFESDATNALLGVAGLAGGKYGNRFGGDGTGRRPGGSGTAQVVCAGLEWLVRHQNEDGSWDSDGFMEHDPASDRCNGPGEPEHDVGVTGLALLALLGDGHTTLTGLYKEQVTRGLGWLRAQQDHDTGLIGERIGHSYMYRHAIASLALCEAYYFSRSPILRGDAQRAVGFVTRARNPYGAWRYDAPPTGDNDSSVTGWMVLVLKSAEDAGLTVDSQAFSDALRWFDEMTDGATGRVGYDSVGSVSSRVPGVNDQFPTDRSECMTAVGLLCRFFLGQDPDSEPAMRKHADLLLRALPEWDPTGLSNDMYYWYYGSYAMYQMGDGGSGYWKRWNTAMKKAVVDSQRTDGAARGSWDPIGPWGRQGGRVYSTALGVLCLEVYFRYSRLIGGH